MISSLKFIPPQMHPWQLGLVLPTPSEFGEFALIGCEQASIETHHQVIVVDEDDRPARGVWVVFGFDSGPPVNIPIRANYWPGAPAVIRGNAQRTDGAGYAQHTFGQGGEDIFILGLDEEGDLKYPSPIIGNCTWQRTPVARFEHTGVCLTFQLRRAGVKSLAERVSALEMWVTTLDERQRVLAEKAAGE